ncbi:MAG TPA: KH domain-containing protein [Acidimicrobiales bacterium]|nr:KH domain-containing protein [Acidimicrobiales bacterium]
MSDRDDEYVAGDVNTIDDDDVVVDEARDADSELTATAVLEYLARSLADEPDAVSVEVEHRGGRVVLSLSVSPDDMGRVIGRRGRTAQALRALVAAAGARDGVTTSVDIVD